MTSALFPEPFITSKGISEIWTVNHDIVIITLIKIKIYKLYKMIQEVLNSTDDRIQHFLCSVTGDILASLHRQQTDKILPQ